MLAALVETTVSVLASPSRFFGAMSPERGIGGPLGYAMIMGTLGVWVSATYGLVFNTIVGSLALPKSPPFLQFPALPSGVGFAVQIVVLPLLLLIWLFIGSGLTNAALHLVGGARRGFEGTFSVFCYSQAFAAFNVIPFCGGLIGLPYLFVVLVVGLAAVHQIVEGRAYSAIVVQTVLICCCGGALALFVALFVAGGLAGLAGSFGQ